MRRDGLEIQVFESVTAAERLKPDWAALYQRCPGATPFLSPEWVLGCWRHFAPGLGRMLLAMRWAESLVGVAALRWSDDGRVALEGDEVSDYLDVLATEAHRARVVAALLGFLADGSRARGCTFERLEQASPLLAGRSVGAPEARVRDHDVCPFLAIPPGAVAPSSIVPSSFWKRVRQTARTAERQARTELWWSDGRSGEAALERLFCLHGSRWQARGETGALADEPTRSFHREVAPRLLAQGQAWLVELRMNDEPAALNYVLVAPARALYYIGGFEPAFARWSPGRLALAAVVERAARAGYREVDFLRGVEPYKYAWGARDRSTRRLDLEFER